ncbi:hypothetical protein OS493_001551 [Desmophyllum pertusum]|uniref:G-protein coupled receptors family 1 profile domain-containing protein n=1 Tax=Desmophyllum pertusum TaxID=174260 RepID=A0A9X0CZP0_9CNID|nr:hypothetical protein OS493_001551 [Desmophyllum pertusum]
MKVHLISSRFRAFAIASTWVVAMAGDFLFLYFFQLVELKNGEIYCTPLYNSPSSYLTFTRVYTALFHITPLVVMTILYCVIAVTLGRQDKALQCRAVHQKDQRKRRAIKMSVCIVAAFYICSLPMLLLFLLLEYMNDTTVPCLFSKVLMFLAYSALFLSSAINPVICMTFVQSYRRGLKEIFNRCCKQPDENGRTRGNNSSRNQTNPENGRES